MRRESRQVFLTGEAWGVIVASAAREPMRETGGILLGWRQADGVHVEGAIEVPDSRAGHTRYRRRHVPAEASLASVLKELPAGSPVGYIGEWHSHPAPVGPSFADRCELRRISRRTGEIAMVVAVYDARAQRWAPTAVTARNGRLWRACGLSEEPARTTEDGR